MLYKSKNGFMGARERSISQNGKWKKLVQNDLFCMIPFIISSKRSKVALMTGVRIVFTFGESGNDRQQAWGKVRDAYKFLLFIWAGWWLDRYVLCKKSLSGLWLQFVHLTWSHQGQTPSFRESERIQWPGAVFTTSTQSSRCQEAAFRWGSRRNIAKRVLSSQHRNVSSNRS